ncbi:MAG: DNA polymerase III subunit [Parcubacteria group bacterium]|jgi:DNA polymerase-3 subunit delta'
MNIIGHKKIVDLLNKSIKSNAFHHAYLFSGSEHVGKFTVALDFAKNILGDIAETNPDFIIVRPEIEEKDGKTRKKAISVENMRELQRKLSMTPNGKHKIAIIDDAEFLNIQSQNAILKTLEEPPKNVIIILVTQNQEKLLPTIVSRCVVKKFYPVSNEEISEIIPSTDQSRDEIIFWSLGRPGLALNYINDKKELDAARETLEDFKKIISGSVAERFSMAEIWSKDTPALIKKLSLWMVLVRHSIIQEENYLEMSAQKSLAVLDRISGAIETLKSTNANARLVLENIMLEI